MRPMLHLLLTYAYPIMIPLSLIEGPIVALAAGAGTAGGRVDPRIASVIMAFGALFQDTVYYWLGRWASTSPRVGAFVERTRLARATLRPLEAAWRDHLVATLASSKFAYGLYGPILVTAGMARAPFWRFLIWSLTLSAVVLGAWFGAGFGLQRAYGAIGDKNGATWIMAGLGVLGIGGLAFIARRARRRLGLGKAQAAKPRGAAGSSERNRPPGPRF